MLQLSHLEVTRLNGEPSELPSYWTNHDVRVSQAQNCQLISRTKDPLEDRCALQQSCLLLLLRRAYALPCASRFATSTPLIVFVRQARQTATSLDFRTTIQCYLRKRRIAQRSESKGGSAFNTAPSSKALCLFLFRRLGSDTRWLKPFDDQPYREDHLLHTYWKEQPL